MNSTFQLSLRILCYSHFVLGLCILALLLFCSETCRRVSSFDFVLNCSLQPDTLTAVHSFTFCLKGYSVQDLVASSDEVENCNQLNMEKQQWPFKFENEGLNIQLSTQLTQIWNELMFSHTNCCRPKCVCIIYVCIIVFYSANCQPAGQERLTKW